MKLDEQNFKGIGIGYIERIIGFTRLIEFSIEFIVDSVNISFHRAAPGSLSFTELLLH